jgi:hypothetical protein
LAHLYAANSHLRGRLFDDDTPLRETARQLVENLPVLRLYIGSTMMRHPESEAERIADLLSCSTSIGDAATSAADVAHR